MNQGTDIDGHARFANRVPKQKQQVSSENLNVSQNSTTIKKCGRGSPKYPVPTAIERKSREWS